MTLDPQVAEIRAHALEWSIRVHERCLSHVTHAAEEAIVHTAREFEKYLTEG